MRRGPIRKEMQKARQAGRTATTADEAREYAIDYNRARAELAEAKGQESPEFCAEFEAGS